MLFPGQKQDFFGILPGEEKALAGVAVTDVKGNHLRMVSVLHHDGVDLLPGPKIVVGGDPHLIEDLQPPLGNRNIFFGQQGQGVEHTENQGNFKPGENASHQQEDYHSPAGVDDIGLPGLQLPGNVDRAGQISPGKRFCAHRQIPFFTKRSGAFGVRPPRGGAKVTSETIRR